MNSKVSEIEQIYDTMFHVEQELEVANAQHRNDLNAWALTLTSYLTSQFKDILTQRITVNINSERIIIRSSYDKNCYIVVEPNGETCRIIPTTDFHTDTPQSFELVHMYYHLAQAAVEMNDLYREIDSVISLYRESSLKVSTLTKELQALKEYAKTSIYNELRRQLVEGFQIGDTYEFPNKNLTFTINQRTSNGKDIEMMDINTRKFNVINVLALADRILRESSERSIKLAKTLMDATLLKVKR